MKVSAFFGALSALSADTCFARRGPYMLLWCVCCVFVDRVGTSSANRPGPRGVGRDGRGVPTLPTLERKSALVATECPLRSKRVSAEGADKSADTPTP